MYMYVNIITYLDDSYDGEGTVDTNLYGALWLQTFIHVLRHAWLSL